MCVLVTLEFTGATDTYRKSSITQRDETQINCVFISPPAYNDKIHRCLTIVSIESNTTHTCKNQ